MYSVIRTLEYKLLGELSFSGKVLDIGGSKKSGYHQLIKGAQDIVTVNINPEYGCDLVFDIQERFPLESGVFDAVVSLNVFEHVFGFHNAFSESSRVLRKGGRFIFAVPFMHHIHASPDDFFRFTESSLRRLLTDYGFVEERIVPLGYSLFGLIFQICGGVLPTSFLRNGMKIICIFFDRVLLSMSSRYRTLAKRIPLGYFVVGVKE